eukprot:jgi/Mesvir1/4066/Mv15839-RA.2
MLAQSRTSLSLGDFSPVVLQTSRRHVSGKALRPAPLLPHWKSLHGLRFCSTVPKHRGFSCVVAYASAEATSGLAALTRKGVPLKKQVAEVIEEGLELLEWPLLCQQVAVFAATPNGRGKALAWRVEIGRSLQESEKLLAQTQAALLVHEDVDLSGIFQCGPALKVACKGMPCGAQQLLSVALTLRFAAEIAANLEQTRQHRGWRPEQLAPLQSMLGGVDDVAWLADAILQCIESRDGSIMDTASKALCEVRATIKRTSKELSSVLQAEAARAVAEGAYDTAVVTQRRMRQCIAIKASRKDVFPGGLTLDTSKSAATAFVEPASVIPLNNAMRALYSAEKAEEAAVLKGLSEMLAEQATPVRRVLGAVTALDLALARARHALWLRGVKPTLLPPAPTPQDDTTTASNSDGDGSLAASATTTPNGSGVSPDVGAASEPNPPLTSGAGVPGGMQVSLLGLRHPILWQQAHPLPPPREVGGSGGTKPRAVRGGTNARGATNLPATDQGVLQPSVAEQLQEQGVARASTSSSWNGDQAALGAGSAQESLRRDGPVPVDIQIREGIRVVTITGPSTGGKTATLKALGLATLMAKAGMYLPTKGAAEASSGLQQDAPVLPWCSSVLVDIGDEQSLEQNLSTFSGHVSRICRILKAARPDSLVLLDEIGSGTDPSEGAALGQALLQYLSDSVALTLATTHYPELKVLPAKDVRFDNASMEFDFETLRPTYRMLWGQAGSSCALSIAQRLGLRPEILQDAQQMLSLLTSVSTSERASNVMGPLSEQLGRLKAEAASSRDKMEAARAECDAMRADIRYRSENQPQQLEQLAAEFKQSLKDIEFVVVESVDELRQLSLADGADVSGAAREVVEMLDLMRVQYGVDGSSNAAVAVTATQQVQVR